MPTARRSQRDPASLRIRDFLALVHEGVRARLGPRLDGMTMRQRFGYAQYYRGDPGVHFEVWVQRKTQRLEVGLHFETPDRERNYACAAALAARADEVAAAVGPEYELEEWTPAWTRLHHSSAAPSLTPELAEEAAERVVALMRGMWPLLEDVLAAVGAAGRLTLQAGRPASHVRAAKPRSRGRARPSSQARASSDAASRRRRAR
jgi:hypothetical protein